MEGSEIVIFSLVELFEANNSANFAAETVIETESDRSSKKFGEDNSMEGFVPKLEP